MQPATDGKIDQLDFRRIFVDGIGYQDGIRIDVAIDKIFAGQVIHSFGYLM